MTTAEKWMIVIFIVSLVLIVITDIFPQFGVKKEYRAPTMPKKKKVKVKLTDRS